MNNFPPNYIKVFTPDECDEIIKHAETLNNWELHEIPDIKKYERCSIIDLEWASKKVIKYLKEHSDIEITEPTFLICFRFKTGGFFVKHKDYVPEMEFYNKLLFNVNSILNEDFEGGKFILNDVEYPLNRGYMYYYNSDILHEVTEVTNGTRYTLMFGVFTDNIKRKQMI